MSSLSEKERELINKVNAIETANANIFNIKELLARKNVVYEVETELGTIKYCLPTYDDFLESQKEEGQEKQGRKLIFLMLLRADIMTKNEEERITFDNFKSLDVESYTKLMLAMSKTPIFLSLAKVTV